MLLTLIRHGESVSNAAGIWQGQSDAELSDRGRLQADALARRLAAGPGFDRLFSSDLRRARVTAEAVGGALGLEVVAQDRWREIHLGAWEGLSRTEVGARYPGEVAALARGEDIAVGGGERWGDLGARVLAAVRGLEAEAAPDSRIAVVAHGGVIITLISALWGLSHASPRLLGKLSNTGITTIALEPGGMRLVQYNDALHADEDASWRHEGRRGHAVVALRARGEAGGLDAMDALLGAPGAREPSEIAAQSDAIARWGQALLPHEAHRLAPPAEGSRSLSTAGRPGGTLWSWNEG